MASAARTDADRDATIGRSTRLRGRISGDGDLLVEGTVEGDISVVGDVTIAEGARTTSNVEANGVVVRGEVEGDVRARGTVVVETGARLHGDVHGEAIALEDGAEFVGRLHLDVELPPELGRDDNGRRR